MPPASSDILEAVVERGGYLIVAGFGEQLEILKAMQGLLAEGTGNLQGSEARKTIEKLGPKALHRVLPAEQIGPLRDFVMPRIRPALLRIACKVGRKLLGIQGEFFVDDYTVLRINFPYSVAVRAPRNTENPGTGRMNPSVLAESRKRKHHDPEYDPHGFNRNEPPAAWAHGAHKDTWAGHSRQGINLWWAMDDVAEECAIVLYPETFGRDFVPDRRSLYMQEGQALPRPTPMSLRRGEMLVFNPETMHCTHLNTGNTTRVALSARLNPSRPKFNPECFYSREFWHSSADLESGRLDRILFLPREENLEEVGPTPARTDHGTPAVPEVTVAAGEGWLKVCAESMIPAFGKLLVRLAGREQILLVRGERDLRAVQARCAHLGTSLAYGHHDDERIWCPTHAVPFTLASGRSCCDLLQLKTYSVREEDGMVWLRIGGDQAR